MHLQFGTDRDGRTTESCSCGYRAYLQTRGGNVHEQRTLGAKVDIPTP